MNLSSKRESVFYAGSGKAVCVTFVRSSGVERHCGVVVRKVRCLLKQQISL